jgi:hypothetical protein
MKKIKEQIFKKYYGGFVDIRVSDLPPDLQPDDIIDIEYVDAFYSENNSWDDHTYLRIFRYRDETEGERTKRLKQLDDLKLKAEKRRYAEYLKLKAIYENEGDQKV